MKITTLILFTALLLIPFEVLFYALGNFVAGNITFGAILQLVIVNFLILGLKENKKK